MARRLIGDIPTWNIITTTVLPHLAPGLLGGPLPRVPLRAHHDQHMGRPWSPRQSKPPAGSGRLLPGRQHHLCHLALLRLLQQAPGWGGVHDVAESSDGRLLPSLLHLHHCMRHCVVHTCPFTNIYSVKEFFKRYFERDSNSFKVSPLLLLWSFSHSQNIRSIWQSNQIIAEKKYHLKQRFINCHLLLHIKFYFCCHKAILKRALREG